MKTNDINRDADKGKHAVKKDILRSASGKDINYNSNGVDDTTEASVADDATTDIPPDATLEDTVVEVQGKSLKDKFIAQTNKFGVTQSGKLTRTFFWGFGIGIGGVLLYRWLKREGYIKMNFKLKK